MSEPVATPCPSHPDMTASNTCLRCGSFTCIQCRQLNPSLCPKCAQRRVPFLFNRDNVELFELLSATWNNAVKPHWLELCFGGLIAVFLPFVAGYVFQIPAVVIPIITGSADTGLTTIGSLTTSTSAAPVTISIVFYALAMVTQVLLQSSFQRGLVEMARAAWNGQKPQFSPLFNFKTGFKTALAFLLMSIPLIVLIFLGVNAVVATPMLITTLGENSAVSTGLLSFIVGALFFAAAIALSIWLLPTVLLAQPFAENPDIGIIEAIRLCFETCKGFRLKIVGMMFISFALVMGLYIAGILALCIGLLAAIPLGMALMTTYQTGFWKAISTPGPSSGVSNRQSRYDGDEPLSHTQLI